MATNYDKLIASWKTPAQIQEAINAKYWADSKEAKQTSSFISSQAPIQTPEQAKTQWVNVLTPEQLKAKNLGTNPTPTPTIKTSTTWIQTPQQAKTQGVNVLSPEQLKAKNLWTWVTTSAETKITEDKNLASLNKLYEKWYTTEQIKHNYEKHIELILQNTIKHYDI